MTRRIAALLLAAALVGACADEDPTSIGGDLLSSGQVRTVELVLDAPDFLLQDTAATGFAPPADADFQLVAEDFGGTLDAHALFRFGALPRSVSYRTVGDTLRNDTLPTFPSGSLVFRIDSATSITPGPIVLRLYRIAEGWDPRSATWQMAVDSGAIETRWQQPGGPTGLLVDTAIWQPSADTVLFTLDSVTIARFTDTTTTARGAMIVAETPGARIRGTGAYLALQARPSARRDTLVSAAVAAGISTFVYDPPAPPPAPSELRVGGTPAWRSYLRFARTLRERQVGDCGSAEGCFRLSDATISYAALVLQTAPVAEAFRAADSVRVDARGVLESPFLPLSRSLLSGNLVSRSRAALAPSAFVDQPVAVELPVTGFLRELVSDTVPASRTTTSNLLALLASPEGTRFSHAAFGAIESPRRPKLRLVLTVANLEGIR